MDCFVSWDGDKCGRLIGLARLNDNVEEIRRVDQAIFAGNEVFRSWVLEAGGSVVEIGGDEGAIQLPADRLAELPAIREKYLSAVGSTVSVGVGMKISEASKALLYQKMQGGDGVCFYTDEVGKAIEEAKEGNERSEKDKILDEYLKSEQPSLFDLSKGNIAMGQSGFTKPKMNSGVAAPESPVSEQSDHSPGEVIHNLLNEERAPLPESTHAAQDFEDQFHQAASVQGEQDVAQQGHTAQVEQLKVQVVSVLQQVKGQAALLEQLKQVSPEVYGSIMNMTHAMLALAHEVAGQDPGSPQQSIQKNEGGVCRYCHGGALHKAGDPQLENLAAEYTATKGIPYGPHVHSVNEGMLRSAAQAYESLGHTPYNPQVKNAYDALKNETLAQYRFLQSKGYSFEPAEGAVTPTDSPSFHDAGKGETTGMPYSSADEVFKDINNNKHLHVFTGGNIPHDHPLAEAIPNEPLGNYNNVFRAVHDVFGHAKGGTDFGHEGEDHTWSHHARMYSPLARDAMTTETRGQNSAWHFGQHGEHNRSNPHAAIYPEQKAALMPKEFSQLSTGSEQSIQKNEGAILEKMALIHNDPTTPYMVYRVEGPEGRGPYGAEPYEVAQAAPAEAEKARFKHKKDPQPAPMHDFPMKEWELLRDARNSGESPYRFGFETPEHAREWFGPDNLDQMAKHGYQLKQVPASKVWQSKSKKQVFFLPHKVDKAEMQSSSLDKAKLSLPRKVPKPRMDLPVGSQVGDKIKVRHSDNRVSWKEMSSGMILSQDPAGHATSSRTPGSR